MGASGSRRQTARGFTLVELMVVVAIIASAMLVTTVMATRYVRGEKAPAAARGLLSMLHEARATAVSTGLPTRVALVNSTPRMQVVSQQQGPNNTWTLLGGATVLPLDMELCDPDNAPKLVAVTPTCPMDATYYLCFATNGSASYSATGACPGPAARSGATLYAHTTDGSHNFKLVVYGLTGLPRLSDSW